MKITLLFTFTFSLFTFISCLSDPEDEILQLKVEETSCTEAWISIYGPGGRDITLQRDDSTIMEFTLTQPDTTVMDTALTPGTTYRYRVYSGNETGNSATAITLDTTSHNFTWQVYEFGGEAGYGSSSFSDVSIINESDIWVTGDISTAEGNFNAAHWDGSIWTLVRIETNACGGVSYPPTNTVYAFADDKILFGHIDGSITNFNSDLFINDCGLIEQLNGSVRKIWGRDSDDFYVVSANGFAAKYTGSIWYKINTGTTENIQDIWGAENTKTDKDFILCTASQTFRESEDLLLKINEDNTVSSFDWPYEDLKPYSMWFKNERKIFVCGDRMTSLTGLNSWKVYDNLSPYFMHKVRGNELNNVYTVGGYGYIAHFNGKSWYELPSTFYGSYVSVDVKDNLVIAVGYTSRSARLIMLNRN